MPRHGGTQHRGYGIQHQRRTAELKAQMRADGGAVCARGGEWMQAWQLDLPSTDPQSIDGDHVELPVAHGGRTEHLALSCAHHNRQHGARLGNSMRGRGDRPIDRPRHATPPDVLITSRDW